MTIDNTTIQIVTALITACWLFTDLIVHWDKIRPVLTSSAFVLVIEVSLIGGCFWLGRWAVVVGANVYIMLEFFDFVRRNDNSCGAIGSTILTIALGVFNFAIQFALAVKGH